MEWVLEQGVTWDTIVLGENVNGLEYLVASDLCETNVDVSLLAARLGHLEILQYAVEHGCPWNQQECLRVAEEKKHDHVVEWITNYAREASSSE